MDRKEKKIIKILVVIYVLAFTTSFVVFVNKDSIVRRKDFEVPIMDINSVVGKPLDVDDDLTYQEISVRNDYTVYLCATPKIIDNKLIIYFTSGKKNKDLLKIRILGENGYLLGESNLIEPNSYIKEIKLNKQLEDNELISVKVMSYERDTYYSNGSFKANLFVKKMPAMEE